MAVLAVAGEVDCIKSSSTSIFYGHSGSGSYEATYSRGAIGGNSTTPPTYTIEFNDTTKKDIWLHFKFDIYTLSSEDPYVYVYDSNGDTIFRMYHTSSGTPDFFYHDGATWQQFAGTSLTGQFTVDVHLKIDSIDGIFEAFVNGVSLGSITGNTEFRTGVGMAEVRVYACMQNSNDSGLSQLIVADEETIGWKLLTKYPTSDGANTDFTGSYTAIDEGPGVSDADFIASSTANDKFTFGSTAKALPDDGLEIKAVAVAARARYQAGAPSTLKHLVRVSAIDYEGDAKALSTGFAGYQHIWDTNPNTTNPWQRSEIDALEFGVKSEA